RGCVGRREATGRGVTYCILEALQQLGLKAGESTAVVQGFGNVGSVVCQELAQRGVRILAVGDRYGSIHNPQGIDIAALVKHMAAGNRLPDFCEAEPLPSEQLLTTPCTILVPAALERVITIKNAAQLKCRILAEAANGPTTPDADLILDQRWDEVFVIPDILCNAGGVIVSYFEWVQGLQAFLWSESEVTDKLFRILE